MGKQNNLKDYLTDLYDGISSKKPDASRNPQNFRAEIEAIKTGGIPWDGDYTIEGDALPEPPKAYHPTSADELPEDAPDGSLAVVGEEIYIREKGKWVKGIGGATDDSIIGFWVFNDELTPATFNASFDFECNLWWAVRENFSKMLFDDGSLHYYAIYGNHLAYENGWEDNSFKLIKILTVPPSNVEAWIRANAKKVVRESSKCYYLSTDFLLPDDEPDGSLAIVESSDEFLGTWEFGNVEFRRNMSYPVLFKSYGSMFAAIETDEESMYYSVELGDYSEYVFTKDASGWSEEEFQTITIFKSWNSDFEDWIKSVATRIAPLYTLYSRENGEWVNKGEI